MATKENAMEAFAGESQANRKYAAFAEKATEEGYPGIARLFKAASEAEAIHARRILKAITAIGKTEENLTVAVSGETHEFTEMYPGFVKEAEAEKMTEALQIFRYAMQAEEVHAGLYKKALAAIRAGRDLGREKVFLCPICGNVMIGEAPEKCPICSAVRKVFLVIE
jgi:rubrerythrin